MILSDPSIVLDPGGYVLDQVEAKLVAAFASPPWNDKFPGIPLVTENPVEAADWIKKNTHRPFCMLEVSSCTEDREYNERGRWLVEVSIESVTLSASSPLERALKAAVISILGSRDASNHFDALGIEESSAGTNGLASGALPERINPAFFMAAVHVAA